MLSAITGTMESIVAVYCILSIKAERITDIHTMIVKIKNGEPAPILAIAEPMRLSP